MAAMEQETQTTQGQFTSLGTTVLDDIYVEDRLVASNSLGGGAIWAAIGARIFADTTQQVSLRIVAGYDFPSEVEGSLRHYGISFRLTRQRNAPSTRAELRYLDASLETRAFRYLNNVLQPKPADLSGTPMLWSRALHLLSAPQEVAGTISELMAVRSYRGMRPLFIWEPRPATCVPENLTYLIEAVKHVDVFSPNHIELLAFFDEPASTLFYKTQIENYAWKFVDSGVGPYCDGIVVSTSNVPSKFSHSPSFLTYINPLTAHPLRRARCTAHITHHGAHLGTRFLVTRPIWPQHRAQ